MKIGVDARLFANDKFTGISRSVHEILKYWANEYPEHEYYLFFRKTIHLEFELPSNWHIVNTPWVIDTGKFWSFFQLPKLVKQLDLDVFWGTNYTLPRKLSKKTKYYVTIYDLALFKFKGIGARSNTIRVKLFSKNACNKADKIITISEATKQDIIDIFGIDPRKIIVSYCGGLPVGYKKLVYNENIDVNPVLKFDEKFFLFISTIEPRKNVISIVKAFEQFVDQTDSDMKLILAGRKGWNCDEIYATIEASKYKNRIILPGYISENDKAFLLNKATAFVYPSLYEGFGIPILEAFEYGLPVLTANVSSMPEVGGNGALYIDDPMDTSALSQLMKRVVELTEYERQEIVNKMDVQLKKFSWEKNAEEMMEIVLTNENSFNK